MTVVERVHQLVAPVLGDLGLDLYDLDYVGGTLRVTVDRSGGVDLDTIALATRLISRELDHADPVPGRYTLEVTSPGLERPLRTPRHFAAAVGTTVAIRTHPEVEGERRVQGVVAAADDDGVVVRTESGVERRLAYEEIERARTVFEWGATPRPAKRKAHAS
jgi:ribosome maturation factor RimP